MTMIVVLACCTRVLAEINESCRVLRAARGTAEVPCQIVTEPQSSECLTVKAPALRAVADATLLTNRECDILEYVYRGWRAKAIGRELCLSEATVKTHMWSIYRKFDVHSQQEVIAAVDAFHGKPHGVPALHEGK
ncbi:MAG: LuxR C-terminal-related transcriptional regulator, partial [Raoultibacter sp.]